ncbi:MAG: transporter substrate-binding domain-containing protein [Proteobacteria bacterium]|nr:transporter substrate-binding domain-containing protein [Pseudomonadota bacterium]
MRELDKVRTALAPTGTLRTAINLGNAVLAQRGTDGAPSGVTVDLSREIAHRLGVPVQLTGFDAAAKVVDALGSSAYDIGFLAVDPKRADTIDFTAPYVLIEGAYIVHNEAPYQTPADIDQPGVRIGVGKGAAYDLFLSRELKSAELVRYPTSADVFDGFLRDRLEAGANIRQPAAAFAARHGGLRVLAEPFMQIRQAVAIPRGKAPAPAWVDALLVELKASGFIAAALQRSGQGDALVAP